MHIIFGEDSSVDQDEFIPHQRDDRKTTFGGLSGNATTDVKKKHFSQQGF